MSRAAQHHLYCCAIQRRPQVLNLAKSTQSHGQQLKRVCDPQFLKPLGGLVMTAINATREGDAGMDARQLLETRAAKWRPLRSRGSEGLADK